jgi:hypothetical protein
MRKDLGGRERDFAGKKQRKFIIKKQSVLLNQSDSTNPPLRSSRPKIIFALQQINEHRISFCMRTGR